MARTQIEVVFDGGPHHGKEGQYVGPDAETVQVLYVTEGTVAYFASDPASAFVPAPMMLIYDRNGTTRKNRERFTYRGRTDT